MGVAKCDTKDDRQKWILEYKKYVLPIDRWRQHLEDSYDEYNYKARLHTYTLEQKEHAASSTEKSRPNITTHQNGTYGPLAPNITTEKLYSQDKVRSGSDTGPPDKYFNPKLDPSSTGKVGPEQDGTSPAIREEPHAQEERSGTVQKESREQKEPMVHTPHSSTPTPPGRLAIC